VLYLYRYTTYDTSSFYPISSTSCPLILVHPWGILYWGLLSIIYLREITNVEILPVWKRRQITVGKTILLGLQMTTPRIQTLLEKDILEVRVRIHRNRRRDRWRILPSVVVVKRTIWVSVSEADDSLSDAYSESLLSRMLLNLFWNFPMLIKILWIQYSGYLLWGETISSGSRDGILPNI